MLAPFPSFVSSLSFSYLQAHSSLFLVFSCLEMFCTLLRRRIIPI
ncbi:unnamed protein product [Spirodela intermedia]|uniref:Uncharacterized protein n=1 Tax=Spirodela intermedia TaxID=51605 RepID=A0A7I8JU57_SPIIN|nr:unnamed protein product [Spirodela intermedia]CAA6673718.1 unnamed protein product [Spirodela intermedia]